MLPWKTIIKIDTSQKRPVYIQIADHIIEEILAGRLTSGKKIPGTRILSEKLNLNRKTVALAYDELVAQGWINIIPSKGAFVGHSLPLIKQTELETDASNIQSDFIQTIPALNLSFRSMPTLLEKRIDDGSPDYRMAPIDLLIKTMRSLSKGRIGKNLLLDRDPYGEKHLRASLSSYLSDTRAINGSPNQLLITRGSQMALYLTLNLLLKPGDNVMVSRLNYLSANQIILQKGGQLVEIDMENDGINVDQIEQKCRSMNMRAIYITPHHHFPTTVTMSVEKRIKLLEIARKYDFAIIEDDYDYDYHYMGTPILPLASLDKNGNVIYIGSFGKMLAPSIRIGYMYGHEKIIEECSAMRRMIDKVGDPIMERAIGQLIEENEIQRSLKKAVKAYKIRRDLFCDILDRDFNKFLEFDKPDGGMAIWTKWKNGVDVSEMINHCRTQNLSLDVDYDLCHEACRLGFASVNEVEIVENLALLKESFKTYSRENSAL